MSLAVRLDGENRTTSAVGINQVSSRPATAPSCLLQASRAHTPLLAVRKERRKRRLS